MRRGASFAAMIDPLIRRRGVITCEVIRRLARFLTGCVVRDAPMRMRLAPALGPRAWPLPGTPSGRYPQLQVDLRDLITFPEVADVACHPRAGAVRIARFQCLHNPLLCG